MPSNGSRNYEDYERPVGGFAGDPLSTSNRYEMWRDSEWIADALLEMGIVARRGVVRFFSERAGISVDVDKYSGSPLLPYVARQYYRPTMRLLRRFYRERQADMTLQTTALNALPGKLCVGQRHEEARRAMSLSRIKLSEMNRKLRDEGWSAAGFEILIIREEYVLDEDGSGWKAYPHYHIVIGARRGHGSRAELHKFLARIRELWERALRRIEASFPGLCARNTEIGVFMRIQQVRSVDRLASYLAKPPSLPRDAGKQAVQWLHRITTKRDQLTATHSFKAYKREVAAAKQGRRNWDPVVEVNAEERFYRVMNPSVDLNPRARAWREQLDLDKSLEEWLRPRARNIYDWATHQDLEYRNRLNVDQLIMDAVCDVLGVDYVEAPGVRREALQRSEEAESCCHWHGPQAGYTVLRKDDPPPF